MWIAFVLIFGMLSASTYADTMLKAYTNEAGTGHRVWSDRFGTASKDFICYEPSLPSKEWKVVGQRGQPNHDELSEPIMAFKESVVGNGALAPADGFTFIWDDTAGTNIHDGSAWRPICPKDYQYVGDVFYPDHRLDKPGPDLDEKFRCVLKTLVEGCIQQKKIWDDSGSTSIRDISVWIPLPTTDNLGGFLYVNNVHAHPPSITMYCIKHSSYAVVYEV